jgi:CRISPR-associated protein Cas2
MPRSADYIAAYDVTSDKERGKVAEVLEGFGFRVQRSVFELRLSRGQREQLLRKLAALNLKTGFVTLYRWDSSAKRHEVGTVPPRPHDEGLHAYVL